MHPENHASVGHFPIEDVAALLADDFLSGLGVQLDRDLVAHRSRGHKNRRLTREDFSSTLLQSIDRRIFAINIVSDFGLGHGDAHFRRWFGHGIGTQMNNRGTRGMKFFGGVRSR